MDVLSPDTCYCTCSIITLSSQISTAPALTFFQLWLFGNKIWRKKSYNMRREWENLEPRLAPLCEPEGSRYYTEFRSQCPLIIQYLRRKGIMSSRQNVTIFAIFSYFFLGRNRFSSQGDSILRVWWRRQRIICLFCDGTASNPPLKRRTLWRMYTTC
jgi:hypothetical protein